MWLKITKVLLCAMGLTRCLPAPYKPLCSSLQAPTKPLTSVFNSLFINALYKYSCYRCLIAPIKPLVSPCQAPIKEL